MLVLKFKQSVCFAVGGMFILRINLQGLASANI